MRRALLAAVAAISLAGTASAETYSTANWYDDGGFAVKRVTADSTGYRFCSMERGNFSDKVFTITADGTAKIVMTLVDVRHTWTPGQVRLWVDGRSWTAVATTPAQYPNQLVITATPGVGSEAFFTAMGYGQRLTIQGQGAPIPFSYDVALSGSQAAMTSLVQCVGSLRRTPQVHHEVIS
jgi:hypothetical protein